MLYGLTPIRLAYAVTALLAALGLWSSPWAPGLLRAVSASVVIVIGSIVSWGRWRGTPADRWIADLVLFVARTRRLTWTGPRLRR